MEAIRQLYHKQVTILKEIDDLKKMEKKTVREKK